INKKAKESIATKAKSNDLISAAEKQRSDYVQMIQMALQSAGWNLIIKYPENHLN
ncbi:MAG: hypothetical protein H7X99_06670, partial [Saprospiraceae bacterium]|nr:hypothetical protein [Saprospiraceae bacterium]